MESVLSGLESQALEMGLILKIQVRRPFNLWTLRLVVAKEIEIQRIQILGEIKGWAYPKTSGFQIDTIRVRPDSSIAVGHLLWSAAMAWALEETPCKKVRLLAIRDGEKQHNVLIRYFIKRGFAPIREVGASLIDLPLRLIWGGSGELMMGDCHQILLTNQRLWKESYQLNSLD